MTRRLPAWFPLALLVLLAALTFWLDRKVQAPPPARDGSARHDPDYVVENFSAIRMNREGTPRYVLRARKMLHYPDDDSTHLEEPRFVHTEPGKAPLHISSDRALISSDGEHAYFMGNVRVVRAADQNHSEVTISTSFLHVIPDQDMAVTDKSVTITDANTIINAVGLELNNQTRVIKLLSRVRGRYDKSR